jgi:hypothetical protein
METGSPSKCTGARDAAAPDVQLRCVGVSLKILASVRHTDIKEKEKAK